MVPAEWYAALPRAVGVNSMQAWLSVAANVGGASEDLSDYILKYVKANLPSWTKYVWDPWSAEVIPLADLKVNLGERIRGHHRLMELLDAAYRVHYTFGVCAYDGVRQSVGLNVRAGSLQLQENPTVLADTLKAAHGEPWFEEWVAATQVPLVKFPEFLGFCRKHETLLCRDCKQAFAVNQIPTEQVKVWGWSKCSDCGQYSLAYAKPLRRTFKHLRNVRRIELPPPPVASPPAPPGSRKKKEPVFVQMQDAHEPPPDLAGDWRRMANIIPEEDFFAAREELP